MRKKKRFKKPIWSPRATADEIIRYSWAIGYDIERTMDDLRHAGFQPNKLVILETWAQLDDYLASA